MEKAGAVKEYQNWDVLEETSWRQKSREIWLKEGDRNTRFFHRMAHSHRRRNTILQLNIKGELVREEEALRQGIANAFESLLIDLGEWRANHAGLTFSKIGASQAEIPEKTCSEIKVFSTLNDLNGDKAPRPDWYTMVFWQFDSTTVKEEIMLMFKDFFESGKFVRSMNSTFIVLVPKKAGAEDLKDFRSISLVNSLYKLISKVLANRIKKVMS